MSEIKTFEFDAISSGDGECFAFKVDKDTFIKILGIDEYNAEIEYRKEFHREICPDMELEPQTEFFIYPGEFFKGGKKLKIKIQVEDLGNENT